MIALKDLEPAVLDQVIRRLLSQDRPPVMELDIAARLGASMELREWVEMLAEMAETPGDNLRIRMYTALAIGMEIGYELGKR